MTSGLFFNRALNCLVVFELKTEEFQPELLGKLEFYLEALDRDVKKPRERPSIGVLLCATKDHEVVEYALSRPVSPALVAEYRGRLLVSFACQRLYGNTPARYLWTPSHAFENPPPWA